MISASRAEVLRGCIRAVRPYGAAARYSRASEFGELSHRYCRQLFPVARHTAPGWGSHAHHGNASNGVRRGTAHCGANPSSPREPHRVIPSRCDACGQPRRRGGARRDRGPRGAGGGRASDQRRRCRTKTRGRHAALASRHPGSRRQGSSRPLALRGARCRGSVPRSPPPIRPGSRSRPCARRTWPESSRQSSPACTFVTITPCARPCPPGSPGPPRWPTLGHPSSRDPQYPDCAGRLRACDLRRRRASCRKDQ